MQSCTNNFLELCVVNTKCTIMSQKFNHIIPGVLIIIVYYFFKTIILIIISDIKRIERLRETEYVWKFSCL